MSSMRHGFTMIELIFVVVIIGILSAIAVPKLAATAKETKKALVVEYIASLNRTAGATMYTEAIRTASGSVATATHCGVLSTPGNPYLEPIADATVAPDCTLTLTGDLAAESFATSTFADGSGNRAPYWNYKL